MIIEVLRVIGNVLIHWSALASFTSLALHLRVSAWKTDIGRHLIAYQLSMSAVLALTCINIDWLMGTDWFAVIRLVVFISIPIVLTQRVWIQWKSQREKEDV